MERPFFCWTDVICLGCPPMCKIEIQPETIVSAIALCDRSLVLDEYETYQDRGISGHFAHVLCQDE